MFIERIADEFFAHDETGSCKKWRIQQWANRATRDAYARDATHFVRNGVNVTYDELIA